MKLEDIKEMIDKAQCEQKILIVNKNFYEEHKEEMMNLINDFWFVDLVITNTLDEKTDAIVMDKKLFYGIDY